MVVISSVDRAATFAWSHERQPHLVTGSVAGTVDADFSNDSSLELWQASSEPKALAQVAVDGRFNDLDWSHDPSEPKLIAGALDNGHMRLWRADTSNCTIEEVADCSKHSSAVHTVRFNGKQQNVLASGGNQGEIYIWDVNKCSKADYVPMVPGVSTSQTEEIKSIAWNESLAHVFASAGASTHASIWDLKAKKEVIHLNYTSGNTGLKPQLSVVEWHPANSTQVATATGNDNEPAVIIWDLRNSNTPLRVLTSIPSKGHSKGILSLDWCKQDPEMLLSSGRDDTVCLWNPETGHLLTQYPTHRNWCFKSKFAPETPDMFAYASYDGKVEVQTLQNLVNTLDKEEVAQKSQESETEFWDKVSKETDNEKPHVWELQAPKWYSKKSPAANWAFGGKLVNIASDGSTIVITKPEIKGLEPNTAFADALIAQDFKPLINQRLVKVIDDKNEEDWNMLEKLSMDGKDEFLQEALAFEQDDLVEDNEDSAESFFENIENEFNPEGKFDLKNDGVEDLITKKLVNGHWRSAALKALDNDLLNEALVIALISDDDSVKSTVKNAYFSKRGDDSSLIRLLSSLSKRNLNDLVSNLDIKQWRFTARAIYQFYQDREKEKQEMLTKLGDAVNDGGSRQDALILYMAAGSLDKVASIWLSELGELEKKLLSQNKSPYEAHSECVTEFVERYTVFSKFIGSEQIVIKDDLMQKILEFINITTATGNFELAASFLESLPKSNKDINTERERVLVASGKNSRKMGGAAAKGKYGNIPTHAATLPNAPVSNYPPSSGSIPANSMPIPTGNYGGVHRTNAPTAGMANRVSQIPTTTSVLPANPMAPSLESKYAPSVTAVPAPVPAAQPLSQTSSFIPPPNPYASAVPSGNPNVQSMYAPPAQPFMNSNVSSPKMNPLAPNASTHPPQSQRDIMSGQVPHLNRKANDGWNDLPLKLKDKPSRAKPVSVAPITTNSPSINMGNFAQPINQANLPSGVNGKMPATPLMTPPPQRVSRAPSMASMIDSNPAPKPQAVNPYAPKVDSTTTASSSTYSQVPKAPNSLSTKNPYAPSSEPSTNVTPPVNALERSSSTVSSIPARVPSIGPPPVSLKKKNNSPNKITEAADVLGTMQSQTTVSSTNDDSGPQQMGLGVTMQQQFSEGQRSGSLVGIPQEQQPIVDYFKAELERVTPLTPAAYSKQLKDCNKRLHILFGHLERQDLLTQPTLDKLHQIVDLMKQQKYAEAKQVHTDIATNNAQEGGNWLTGVKRLIGIADAALDSTT